MPLFCYFYYNSTWVTSEPGYVRAGVRRGRGTSEPGYVRVGYVVVGYIVVGYVVVGYVRVCIPESSCLFYYSYLIE